MGWYYVVTEEMRALGLAGNDLQVFAIIHGFSQEEQGCFHGSAAYLADVIGVERRSITRILKRLTDGGFLKKTEIYREGVKFCSYQTGVILSQGRTKCPIGVGQNVPGGSDKMSHNNKMDNEVDKSTSKNKIEIGNRSAFSAPTIEDVTRFVADGDYYLVDPEVFFNHYASNGWMVGKSHMKDWKAAVRSWNARKRAELRTPAPEPLQAKRSLI